MDKNKRAKVKSRRMNVVIHKRVYFEYFGYGIDDVILCEVCHAVAVDIHHVEPKGMGGSKTKDTIENLMALCRECHVKAHAAEISKFELKKIHNEKI